MKKRVIGDVTGRAVIITSYVEGDLRQLMRAAVATSSPFDYIICADGGYDLALGAGIRADVVIGDFDSSASIPDDVEVEILPKHKDITDTAAAIAHAEKKGFCDVIILGGIGGRVDHTIANIQNILGALGRGMSVAMMDGRNRLLVLNDTSVIIDKVDGYKISLFSLTEKCLGVTISGVEYPLNNHTLTFDYPLGISNEFIENRALVGVKKGKLLVVLSQE